MCCGYCCDFFWEENVSDAKFRLHYESCVFACVYCSCLRMCLYRFGFSYAAYRSLQSCSTTLTQSVTIVYGFTAFYFLSRPLEKQYPFSRDKRKNVNKLERTATPTIKKRGCMLTYTALMRYPFVHVPSSVCGFCYCYKLCVCSSSVRKAQVLSL